MKRVHVLSLLGAAVLAVVLYVVFSSPKDPGLLPGDSGVAANGDTVAEANATGGEAQSGDNADGNVEDADSNRTAIAEAQPMASGAELAKGTLKLRLVDSETQPALPTHASLNSGHFPPGFSAFTVVSTLRGSDDKEQPIEVAADDSGLVVLTDVEPNEDLTLLIGGPHWARRQLQVAALDPGEERDLGEVILSPGVLLSGQVLGPDGKGVAEATISLQDRNNKNEYGFNFGNAPGATTAEATTDEDGHFRIEGVRIGEYSLEASANGYVRASTSLDLVAGNPDHRIDLHLAKGASVSGIVRDQKGKPLTDAHVVLVRARGFSTYQWDHERILEKGTPVGEDGSFELSGLSSDGNWRVAAAAPGYARGRSENVTPGAKVNVELEPRMELVGKVQDAAGRAVADAQLTMTKSSADRNRDYFNRARASSDEKGQFKFDDLKEGTYSLEITSPAGVLAMDEVKIRPVNQPLTLTLPAAQALTVAVLDPDGNPLANARVSADPPSGQQDYAQVLRLADASGVTMETTSGPGSGPRSRSAKTDADGFARFYGLAKGTWTIRARLEQYAGQPVEVECDGEAGQELTYVLHPASKVRLTAVDATGQIVAGARVVLKMEGKDNDFGQRESVTDAWGLATWTDLAPGIYRITESATNDGGLVFLGFDENATEEEEAVPENDVVFELKGGEIAKHQIVMAAKAVTSVLVTRLGSPAANVTVELENPGNDSYGWYGFDGGGLKATTNAQGLATLPPCDAGTYRLKARATSASPATEMEVNLAPGQQQISVELASGVLTGTVVGTSGPVAGATVTLGKKTGDETTSSIGRMSISFATADGDEPEFHTMDYRPGQTTARTDDKGQFRFQDVPAGEWQIEVRSKGYIQQTADVGKFDGSGQRDLGIVQLQTGGSLKGRVLGLPVNESPDGFSMNLLQLYDESGNAGNMTVLRKDGEFHFKDLTPGVYTLGTHVEGESVKSDPITVRAGDPTEYTWSL